MRIPIYFASTSLCLQIVAQSLTLSGSTTVSIGPDFQTSLASASFVSSGSTISLQSITSTYGTVSSLASGMASSNGTRASNATMTATSSNSRTLISGTIQTTSTINSTATRNSTRTPTISTFQPTNTVPCNGYAQFCSRRYSNITHVAAHNSPFIQQNNIAANQMLDVTTQLNDGIRMLQFQAHLQNGTMYLCHTSCSLLNAGTMVSYLTTVRQWMDANPYDVVTILIGNYGYVNPGNFTRPFTDSGMIDYVYTPPTVPMSLNSWPTLGQMILTGQRAVVMLDYEADQSRFPWLMNEFDQMWETPFSPTNRDFPCTVNRPPNQAQAMSRDRMFLANHNLNLDVNFGTMSILIPASNILNETNAVSGYGSAGVAVSNCTATWNRAPNFLLVDFYNVGNFNGSVFQVAAAANNVTYDRNSCCGTAQRQISPAVRVVVSKDVHWFALLVTLFALVWF